MYIYWEYIYVYLYGKKNDINKEWIWWVFGIWICVLVCWWRFFCFGFFFKYVFFMDCFIKGRNDIEKLWVRIWDNEGENVII